MNNMNNTPGKSEENFITAILTQAIEDARYPGLSKKYLKSIVN